MMNLNRPPTLVELTAEHDLHTRWIADLILDLEEREARYGIGCRPDLTARLHAYRAYLARLEDMIRQVKHRLNVCRTPGCETDAAIGRWCHGCAVSLHNARYAFYGEYR